MTQLINLFLIFTFIFRPIFAAPSILLNPEGRISVSALKSVGILSKQNENFIQVIDCSSPIGECRLVNELLGTQFTSLEGGVSVDQAANKNLLVLKGSFDHMFSTRFCGSKLADYFASVDSRVVLLFKSDSPKQTFLAYEQLFRRIFTKFAERGQEMCVLQIVLESSVESTDELNDYLTSLCDEVRSKSSNEIRIELISSTDAKRNDRLSSSLITADFCETLERQWSQIPAILTPIYSKAEETFLHSIETAFSQNLLQAEKALAQMQRRISEGKVISNFVGRVNNLVISTLGDYNKRVLGITLVRERIDRAKNLRSFIISAAQKMFLQLVQIKELEYTRKFQKELAAVYKRNNGESEELLLQAVNQLVRRFGFDYKAALNGFEDEGLGFVVAEDEVKEFTDKIEAIAKAFPESAEARLIELQKMEKTVNKSPRKKKRKMGGLGFSLSLVGMLRPPGFGNLQGFCGYSTSLLGVPLDFLVGVQNDGDSLEVLGEDREQPLLRVQPKIHFDVDLQ